MRLAEGANEPCHLTQKYLLGLLLELRVHLEDPTQDTREYERAHTKIKKKEEEDAEGFKGESERNDEGGYS